MHLLLRHFIVIYVWVQPFLNLTFLLCLFSFVIFVSDQFFIVNHSQHLFSEERVILEFTSFAHQRYPSPGSMSKIVILALFWSAKSNHTISSVPQVKLMFLAGPYWHFSGKSSPIIISFFQLLSPVNNVLFFSFIFIFSPDSSFGIVFWLYSTVWQVSVDFDKISAVFIELPNIL